MAPGNISPEGFVVHSRVLDGSHVGHQSKKSLNERLYVHCSASEDEERRADSSLLHCSVQWWLQLTFVLPLLPFALLQLLLRLLLLVMLQSPIHPLHTIMHAADSRPTALFLSFHFEFLSFSLCLLDHP